MKTIVFFNNKGGVGKTTLACNLVSYLNLHKDKKVLIIDLDPQCNSTQAILSDKVCEEIYLDESPTYHTIYNCVKPLEMGEPSIDPNIRPVPGSVNRYGTDIIPGHPKMSIIEDRLSEGWSKVKAREIGGFRVTNWAHALVRNFKNEYDFIFFDVGPSLGALNRSVILASDYIVTPFGCDIFSLLGIKNIAEWIKSWKSIYDSSSSNIRENSPHIFEDFQLIENTDNKFRFAGYSVQQYMQRKFKAGPRPVKSYDAIMTQIPDTVHEAMSFLYPSGQRPIELGHIPYIYSLIPLSQSSKAPVTELTSSDGLVGAQHQSKTDFGNLLAVISDKLISNTQGNT